MSDISSVNPASESNRLRERVRSLQLPPAEQSRGWPVRWIIFLTVIAVAIAGAWRLELFQFGAAAANVDDQDDAKKSDKVPPGEDDPVEVAAEKPPTVAKPRGN